MPGSTLLTQDEIEALLDLVHAADGAPDVAVGGTIAAKARVERRDFHRPEGLTRESQERLWSEAAATAARIADTLSRWMRLDVRAELLAIEPLYFESFREAVATHVLVYPTKCGTKGAHRGALTIDPSLALAAVDRILGGTGKSRSAPRALTPVEKTVADRLAGTLLRAASEGLSELFPVEPAPSGPSVELRKLSHLHEAKTPVLVATYVISGDVAETEARILLPLEPLQRIVVAAASAAPDALPEPLREVTVEVAVQLGGATIALRDLIALEPGDVIPLDATPESFVTVDVEGRPVGRGRLGILDRKLAVSLESVPRRVHSADPRT